MVDAVFNHCGRKFAPWLDVLEKKEKSAYADWFMIHDWETVENGQIRETDGFIHLHLLMECQS